MPYKIFISFINVLSCYWALFKYGRYFAQRHPKLTEDHKAVGLVLTLERAIRRSQGAVRDTVTRAYSQRNRNRSSTGAE